MCIALPCRIIGVVDAALNLIAVRADGESDQEIVSAALVVTPELPVERLVDGFALIHAGFAISLIDEPEAQSRLQVFAALRGGKDEIDLGDFYADTVEGPTDV
jgi:hydrogenase expression/formation protein HypC